MATITTDTYLDGGTARTAGEAWTINSGAKLTIRSDTRVHANAPASSTGSLGSVTINEGELIWDSTNVRVIEYTDGSGNVPAVGTIISQGAVSGYLLGVWFSKASAVAAVGTSINSNGYIKFREVTGGTFSAGPLTGIGASAVGPDVQGWISIVHDAAANLTIPRLGKHTARGGRFFLETTNGSVGQTFQVPSEGSSAMYAPGLWVETGVGTDQYEYWPGLFSSTNGWSHLHIGEAEGQNDLRQKFLSVIAGGQLKMGGTYTQASTYASLSAQASTYAGIANSATYTWENNKITVYYSSGHLLEVGQQTGLDFTSGSGVDGIFTVLEVLSPYHFTVSATGSGTGGNVIIRPGITVTFTAHTLNIGESVYCDFTTGTGVDGTYEVYAVPSANSYLIKYPHTAALTSGNANCFHTLIITFTAHGLALGNKVYLDFTSGTGVDGVYTIKAVATNTYNVNFAHSAATSGNVTVRRQIGFVAPAGCRTWIPSNILNECATGARATNTVPNITVATRPEWITTSAGAIDLEYVYGCSGYPSFAQAYSVRMRNCAFFDTFIVSECATALDIEDTGVSMQGALDTPALSLTSNFAGGTIKNGRFERGNTPGTTDHSAYIQYCKNIVFDNVQAGIIQYPRSTGYPWQLSYCSGLKFNNSCRTLNGPVVVLACSLIEINDFDYCDRYNGRTNNTTAYYAVDIGAGSANIKIVGFSFGFGGTIQDCHPYNGIVRFSGSSNVKIRNFGTRSSRISGGIWAVNAYGLAYATMTAGNNSDIKIQRVFIDRVRTAHITTTNSDKNMVYESVMCGMYSWSTKAALTVAHADINGQINGVENINSTTGQASVYGTHFVDFFMGSGFGRFVLNMNEPTAETTNQFTMVSGTAKWNSSGGILLPVIGNQAIWEDDVFRKGHTGFVNTALTMAGGTATNYTTEFQIDTGSGYGGSWLTLNGTNLSAISIDPAVGFKMKIRITTIVGNTTAITSIRLDTITTATAIENYYPLDVNTLSLSGVPTGCDLVVLSAGTTTILYQKDSVNSNTLTYPYSGAHNVDIGILKPGYVPYYIRNLSLTENDSAIPVSLTPDRNYI